MRKYNYILLFCNLILLVFNAKAEDSLKVFPIKDFYSIILNHHPVAKQALLLNEFALKELRVARGGFDPKFDFDYVRKEFKGTTYYDYIDNGLKIPLWFGADIKSGFEKNSGLYVDPTNYTPPEGLWYLGLEFPIGQGMVIDERRAVVKKAKIATEISELERIKVINKVLLNASKDYWEWYFQYQRMLQLKMAFALGEIRYSGIKERIIQGDLAGIDSTEALIVVQERWLEYQKALNDFQNAEVMLSNYLWTGNGEPLQIVAMYPEEPSIKESLSDSIFQKLSVYAAESHPDIIKIRCKVRQLEIDKKLKYNNLLPNFSVGLKYLNTPNGNLRSDRNIDYISDNYKVTISLSQPLFIRKERGNYQLAKLKLLQVAYDQRMANREVGNTLVAAYNDVITYKELILFQQKVVDNIKIVFEGEKAKFENGESTLFLVNSREAKMIDSKIKVFELKAKLEKAIAQFYWSAGKYTL